MRFPTMWHVQPAKPQISSDQSLCQLLVYSMIDKLLTEHHLEFLSLKVAAQTRMSLHMSEYHIIGNHMLRLILYLRKIKFLRV